MLYMDFLFGSLGSDLLYPFIWVIAYYINHSILVFSGLLCFRKYISSLSIIGLLENTIYLTFQAMSPTIRIKAYTEW